jgi:hypothetical protein
MTIRDIALLLIGAAVIIMLAALLAAWPANAHMAQTGWAYSFACCSGKDCREVADSEVTPTDDGWVVAATGEVIAYDDLRVEPSGDEFFHVCLMKSPLRVRCLYVPQTWG